jgi:mannose-6-phosphate isomerase
MSDHDKLFDYHKITHVPKPWGYELIFAHTERYVGKILHINQGESLSLQYHEMKEETLYVVDGELKLTIAAKCRSAKARRFTSRPA